jgi:hypothetical protein
LAAACDTNRAMGLAYVGPHFKIKINAFIWVGDTSLCVFSNRANIEHETAAILEASMSLTSNG